jgi:hypothetical protein
MLGPFTWGSSGLRHGRKRTTANRREEVLFAIDFIQLVFVVVVQKGSPLHKEREIRE